LDCAFLDIDHLFVQQLKIVLDPRWFLRLHCRLWGKGET